MTYNELVAAIRTGRGGQKKLAGNTYARMEGNAVVVKYHATDIATITPVLITLDNGGWFTSTTKERINSYCLPSGWQVFQKDKKWYLSRNTGETEQKTRKTRTLGEWVRDKEKPYGGEYVKYPEPVWSTHTYTAYIWDTHPYHNGMTINVNTNEIGNVPPPDVAAVVDAQTKKLSKKIDAYVKGYTNEALAAFLEDLRSGDFRGDCFYCQMVDTTTGEPIDDNDHLMSHVLEGYRMATLAYHAIKGVGYRFPEVIFTSGDLARRAIKKYLKKKLLKGVAV